MMQAKFKGQVTKVDCQSKATKLTIEVDTRETELDKIKLLLDTDVNIVINDNQTTLTVEYPISENGSVTITAEGQNLLEGAKEMLEQ